MDSLFCRRGVHYKQEQYVSLFFQTKKSHFYADFQGQGTNAHYATLNDSTLCYKIRLKQIRSTSFSLHNVW